MDIKKESVTEWMWKNDKAKEIKDAEIKNTKSLLERTTFSKTEIKWWEKEFQKYVPKTNKTGKAGTVRGLTPASFDQMYSTYFPDGDSSFFAAHVFRTFDKDNNGVSITSFDK